MSHRSSTMRGMETDPDDNGILGKVPGQFIAAASKQLPPAETASDARHAVTIDADWAGVVSISFQRQKMRHRRSSQPVERSGKA